VDRALVRYLRGGGVLLALSHMPFPFYYDRDGTVNNAHLFGLPIAGSGGDPLAAGALVGWEQPPDVEDLHFEVDTGALSGLPERVPFPTAGDLRWRPASAAALAAGDVYVPLAWLTDAQDREFGDGIAWIERRASEPVGGRALYAWMRMDDLLGGPALHAALLRFVGERLAEE
jgi:hypothetical protein